MWSALSPPRGMYYNPRGCEIESFYYQVEESDSFDSGKCFYCKQGYSSRCEKSTLFGCEVLDGGQAQYVSTNYNTTLAFLQRMSELNKTSN